MAIQIALSITSSVLTLALLGLIYLVAIGRIEREAKERRAEARKLAEQIRAEREQQREPSFAEVWDW